MFGVWASFELFRYIVFSFFSVIGVGLLYTTLVKKQEYKLPIIHYIVFKKSDWVFWSGIVSSIGLVLVAVAFGRFILVIIFAISMFIMIPFMIIFYYSGKYKYKKIEEKLKN